jgi:hypothetical protein
VMDPMARVPFIRNQMGATLMGQKTGALRGTLQLP